MPSRRCVLVAAFACVLGIAVLRAADVSEAQAEAFTRKLTLVTVQGAVASLESADSPAGPRRTPFTEAELNSYIAFRGQELLPAGVSGASVSILGDGRVSGVATVDLEVVAKGVSTGGSFSPLSYLSGRVPVTVSGVLVTSEGIGRFELDSAAISGVPVPATLLQDMVAYYSRSTDAPEGFRLDSAFPLPARITRIEMGQGQAVVIQ